jgi:putative tryptophan/tyrosine transport system substrate-binding protein
MKRRDALLLLGSAALAWPVPVPARAQQPPAMPVIGFLSARSSVADAHLVAAFRHGLEDVGFVDGKNVVIDFRWGDGHADRVPALARELVARRVALMVAAGGVSSVAASEATPTIPIVFVNTSDPLEYHLVPSISRPGGNVTGISLTSVALGPKRVELLIELLPQAKKLALLVNPATATSTPVELRDMPAAAQARGRTIDVVKVVGEAEFEAAFAMLVRAGADALIVGTDPLFVKARDQLVALAARHAVPAIYDRREYAEAGGLMSYGASVSAGYRKGGVYAGRILKGAKPADLPVEQAATFELVINLKTAKTLDIGIPAALLSRADEVIE